MQGRDCKAVPIHPGNGIVDLTDISPIILLTLIFFFAMVTCNHDILLPNYLWRMMQSPRIMMQLSLV